MRPFLFALATIAAVVIISRHEGAPLPPAFAQPAADRCHITVTTERSHGFVNTDQQQPLRPMQTNQLLVEPLPNVAITIRDGDGAILRQAVTDLDGRFASAITAADPEHVTVELNYNGDTRIAGGAFPPCLFGVHAFYKAT